MFFRVKSFEYNNNIERENKDIEEIEHLINSDDYDLVAGADKMLIYSPGYNKGYRYGPSIMKHEDGTVDMWMSRPGNNYSKWDYIAYRHYDGTDWNEEIVVLTPSDDGEDRCSVCDPGVIYFDGYYYLGYTGTSSYEYNGTNNSAFVARSKYPDGPYEKWNGQSWGGNPEPIIAYEGDPENWGIGEVSFVIYEDDLYIYYTYMDNIENCVKLAKADLSENWPETIRLKNTVGARLTGDSYDVAYDDNLNTFIAFAIEDCHSSSSYIGLMESVSGRDFIEVDFVRNNVEPFAHNIGVAKDESGHLTSDKSITVGYAYGETWGSWEMLMQNLKLKKCSK